MINPMTVRTFAVALGVVLAGAVFAADAPSDENVQPDPVSGIWDFGQQSGLTHGGDKAFGQRYVRAWSGFDVGVEALRLRDAKGFDTFDLWSHDLGSPRFDNLATLWTHGVPARIRFQWDRAVFYGDPLLASPSESTRSNTSTDALVRPAPWAVVKGGYRIENVNIGALARGGLINDRIQTVGVGTDVKVGPGSLGLNFESLAYRERATAEPSSLTNQLGAAYDAVLGHQWLLGANARWVRIHQDGRAASTMFLASANGSFLASRRFWLDGGLNYRDITLGPTLNAYVGKASGGNGRFTWRPSRQLAVRGGIERTEFQRYNFTQTTLEKPHETKLNLRADYRGQGGLRWSAAYQGRGLNNLSPSAVPGLTNDSELFIDSEHKIDLRLSTNVGDGGLAYGFWQYHQLHNKMRDIDQTIGTLGTGVSYPVTEDLLFASDVYYRYLNNNQTAIDGQAPNTLVGRVGLAFNPSPRWHVNADYSRVECYGGQQADQNWLTAGIAWDPGHGHSLSLSYNRNSYDGGTLPGLAYQTDVLKILFNSNF
jgi:hypothetical protein